MLSKHSSSVVMHDLAPVQNPNYIFFFVFLVPVPHWQTYKKPGIVGAGGIRKLKPAPKPQQLLYCDVCKISCGGPQVIFQLHF